MDTQDKIIELKSKFKSLLQDLINHEGAMKKAIEEHSADVEEIYIKILELWKAADKCYGEIKRMQKK